MHEKDPKRFEVKLEEHMALGEIRIVVDTETGVNYLVAVSAGVNAITPLLDATGNIVIEKVEKVEVVEATEEEAK